MMDGMGLLLLEFSIPPEGSHSSCRRISLVAKTRLDWNFMVMRVFCGIGNCTGGIMSQKGVAPLLPPGDCHLEP